MKFQQIVCERCNSVFLAPKGNNHPHFCPSCTQVLSEENAEYVHTQEEISRTLDSMYTSNLKQRGDFESLVDYCVYFTIAVGASDLHLKARRSPAVRKGGILFEINQEVLTNEEVFNFAKKHNKAIVDIDDTTKTFDFSIELNERRLRCNLYHDFSGWCVSLRLIGIITTDFEKLGIPTFLKDMVKRKSGLILITGPTGSGKTTTMSALIQHLNLTSFEHIITIEDPIEFVFPKGQCLITQREIGNDVISYEQALVETLREDPDIIVVGEMRDVESIEAAIRAVETGHIVISTLHTRGSASTINRIIDVFPSEKQAQIRTQLSMNLLCCLTQQLIPTKKVGELVLATEIMIVNDAIRASIRENNLHFISQNIEINNRVGMHTMKQDLQRLRDADIISTSNYEKYQIK